MSEDAARVSWADDYALLRSRARAHLSGVVGGADARTRGIGAAPRTLDAPTLAARPAGIGSMHLVEDAIRTADTAAERGERGGEVVRPRRFERDTASGRLEPERWGPGSVGPAGEHPSRRRFERADRAVPRREAKAPAPRFDRSSRAAAVQDRPREAAVTRRASRPAPPRAVPPAPRAYGSRLDAPAPRPRGGAERRTVVITGQPVRNQPQMPRLPRIGIEPDRTALWAFVLALFLVLMAVATAHA